MKKSKNNIEDICDGELYKSLSDRGVLSSELPYNVSFTLNTDGVPVFKSSNMSIWPVYLTINELPYNKRKLKSNMLLCGLWFGHSKPFMATFMEPLHQEFKELENGISIEIDGNLEKCQGFLLCLTADLPARSAVLNMTQFNGQFSCIKCLSKGENFRTTKGGNIHIFPYTGETPVPRTKEDCINDAHTAYQTNSISRGLKGPSFLLALSSFDTVRSVSIDYMHCILQGITKLLIGLWFTSSKSSESFSLYHFVDVVDSRIKEIKPTNTISRLPRTIKEHFKHWKASELRAWLFHYSLPVLCGVMSPKYLYHYAAFVEGIYLLCTDSISFEDIDNAQRMLNYFVYMLGPLYGDRYLTLNAHSLLHLPQTVKEIGPLWCHSCFPFENANGDLLKMFHGTQFVDIQIVNALNIVQLIPSLTSMIPENSRACKYVHQLMKKYCDVKEINLKFYSFLGKGKEIALQGELQDKILKLTGHVFIKSITFTRLCLYGQILHSTSYSRVYARNSFTIKYRDGHGRTCHGFVKSYIELPDMECPLCIVKPIIPLCTAFNILAEDNSSVERDQNNVNDRPFSENFLNLKMSFVHLYQNEFLHDDVIPLECILSLCVCVKVDSILFICDEPNHFEKNL